EGSHVTCPRCNGTGHIRDTESSALQVLRIIQEEAMKENTAAIHCQVPVEVTAFLLNEKRSEINKIESRFKVNVVLVPNKHLDTPHYKLERLRHDDVRLDEPRASWKMAEEAARELESETGYSKRTEEVKPKQEAAVKGITPEKPAPSAPVRPLATAPAPVAVTPAGGGFIGWLKNLFGMQPATPAPAAPATTEKQTRPQRGERTGERGGDRNRNRRGGAAGRDAAGRGEGANGGRQAQGQQPSPRREEREPREGREAREGREPREAREPRGGREAREPREAREGREPREAREPREGREGRDRDTRGADRAETVEGAPRGERQERGERRERGERAERGERRKQQAETTDALTTQPDAQTAEELAQKQVALGENDAPVDQEAVAREGEERRRRRRGRRGGRREREEDVNGNLAADVAEAEGQNVSLTDEAPVRTAHQPVERKAEVGAEINEAKQVTPVEVVVAAVATESAVVSELHAATETPALAVEMAAKTETVVPVEEAPAAPATVEPATETPLAQAAAAPVEAAQAAPAAGETVSLVEPVARAEAPVQAQAETQAETPAAAPAVEAQAAPAPAETVAPAEVVEAPAAQPAPQAEIVEPQPVVAAVAPAAEPAAVEPAPVAAAPQAALAPQAPRNGAVSAEALKPVLEQAGLVWVNTDAEKLRAAQEATAQTAKPARVVRERKPLPPLDGAPMQQVETGKHTQ
ncbi:MAG TPA: ribonuclease E/G, partial [Paraburkholderia sp.]|nr:ribonuclease E/G [Paraburkholderia sp.]